MTIEPNPHQLSPAELEMLAAEAERARTASGLITPAEELMCQGFAAQMVAEAFWRADDPGCQVTTDDSAASTMTAIKAYVELTS